MEQNSLVFRLRSAVQNDHKRGCEGRWYSCSCGYDDEKDALLLEAADEMDRLRRIIAAAQIADVPPLSGRQPSTI